MIQHRVAHREWEDDIIRNGIVVVIIVVNNIFSALAIMTLQVIRLFILGHHSHHIYLLTTVTYRYSFPSTDDGREANKIVCCFIYKCPFGNMPIHYLSFLSDTTHPRSNTCEMTAKGFFFGCRHTVQHSMQVFLVSNFEFSLERLKWMGRQIIKLLGIVMNIPFQIDCKFCLSSLLLLQYFCLSSSAPFLLAYASLTALRFSTAFVDLAAIDAYILFQTFKVKQKMRWAKKKEIVQWLFSLLVCAFLYLYGVAVHMIRDTIYAYTQTLVPVQSARRRNCPKKKTSTKSTNECVTPKRAYTHIAQTERKKKR